MAFEIVFKILPTMAAFVGLSIVSSCSSEQSRDFEKVEKVTSGLMLEESDGIGSKSMVTPSRSVSKTGLSYLKRYEGEVRCSPPLDPKSHCPYNDSSDFCTIGHGHLIAGRSNCESLTEKLIKLGFENGISDEAAETLLSDDLVAAQLALESEMIENASKLGQAEVTDSQYDALVSFIFNVGSGAFKSSTLLREIRKRETEEGNAEIARQFTRWTKSNGKFVQGLLNRRNDEVEQFFSGFQRPVTPKSFDSDEIDIRVGERR